MWYTAIYTVIYIEVHRGFQYFSFLYPLDSLSGIFSIALLVQTKKVFVFNIHKYKEYMKGFFFIYADCNYKFRYAESFEYFVCQDRFNQLAWCFEFYSISVSTEIFCRFDKFNETIVFLFQVIIYLSQHTNYCLFLFSDAYVYAPVSPVQLCCLCSTV